MAKGIIVVKTGGSAGSANGQIKITDPTFTASPGDGTATPGDGTATPGSTTTTVVANTPVEVGTTIEFTEATNANLGDLVSFSLGSDGKATGITVQSSGTVYSGTISDNINVEAGQVALVSAQFDGKITVNGGFLVVDNSSIEGKIESATAGSYVIIGNNTRIEGKVEVTGASYLIVKGGSVEGKISSTGNVYASITGCTVKGKLEVLSATTCKCSGNNVEGKTNTPGCTV